MIKKLTILERVYYSSRKQTKYLRTQKSIHDDDDDDSPTFQQDNWKIIHK